MSIKNQTYKNIEIIVVDNFSTDSTREIAKKYTDKVFERGPERSAQVNYGVEMAHGEYVYKVDSDFVLDPEVVSECVAKAQEGFDAVVVHNSPDVRVSWIAKIRKFEVDMYKYDITHSSARFVQKEVYEKIGGFNPAITAGEDYDFQNKLNRAGYKTGFIDAEALHLGEPTNIWKHMMRYYDYGKDFVNYRRENEMESKEQLALGRNVYLKNWKSFVKHPIRGTVFIIYSIFKFGAGGVGYLISKKSNGFKQKFGLKKNITRLILSPHYDDATFSLGGMIATEPSNCVVVTVFAGIPNYDVISWWDNKCGFKNSSDAMKARNLENEKSLLKLGLKNNQIINLGALEKQYRPDNFEHSTIVSHTTELISNSSCAELLLKDIEIYAPLNTLNIDHHIVQEVAIRLCLLNNVSHIFLYEDMPYHVRPSAIKHRWLNIQKSVRQSNYKDIVFNSKEWSVKKASMQQYSSQFVGNARHIEKVIYIFEKFRALLIWKPFSYVERVRIVKTDLLNNYLVDYAKNK